MSQKCNLPLKEIREIFQSKDKNQLQLFKRGNLSFSFKNPQALWRYKNLLHQFNESLKNVEDMRIYKQFVKTRTLVKVVIRDWHLLWQEVIKYIKVFFFFFFFCEAVLQF